MIVKARRLYLWGFTGQEALLFQRYLENVEPIRIDRLPAPEAVPVVVHAGAMQAFQDAVDALPDGELPDAVLYLAQGLEEPEGAATYVDQIIKEGDWSAFKELVAAPEQFRLANLAYQLPVAFIEQLEGPISDLDVERLPLPEADRALLASSPVARHAFTRALSDRRWLLGTIAPARPHNDSTTALLRLPLRRPPTRLSERLTVVMEQFGVAFVALVYSTLLASDLDLVSPRVSARRSRRGDWTEADMTQMLEKIVDDLIQGARLTVRWGSYRADLTCSVNGRVVELGPLYHADNLIRQFRVVLNTIGARVWSGSSEEGIARTPLDALEQTLAGDDGELIIEPPNATDPRTFLGGLHEQQVPFIR